MSIITLKNYQINLEAKNNIISNNKKKQSIETDSEVNYMKEHADKEIKNAIITVNRYLKKCMNTVMREIENIEKN